MTLETKTTEQFDKQTQEQIEAFKQDYLAAESVYVDISKIAELDVKRVGNRANVS